MITELLLMCILLYTLYSLLNEEATLKNGSNENLLKRYRQSCSSSTYFTAAVPTRRGSVVTTSSNNSYDAGDSSECFGVKHFAGEVSATA
jgi:hypothetical protein